MVGLAMPLLDSLFVHPDGQRTVLYQGLVVPLPVADLVFGLPEAALEDQITEVADSSPI